MIAQSHLDPVFMWAWEEGLAETIATCHAAVDKLRKHKDFVFVRSDAQLYQWIAKADPKLLEDIKEFINEGRWVPVGGWYLQSDGGVPEGESFIRQALVGQQIFKNLLGVQTDIAWFIDSSSPPATLPKILKHCGFKYFVFSRPNEDRLELPAPLFWWQSDDGSQILAYRIPIRYSTYSDEVERIRETAEKTPDWLDQIMCFFGMGNHGGGPTEQQIQRVIEYSQKEDSPELAFSSPERFFEDVQDNPHIPFYRGCLEPFVIGTLSIASEIKKLHDKSQRAILLAEKFSTLAEVLKLDQYDNVELNRCWENLLFCQFHDILPGTAVKKAHEDAKHMLGGVLSDAGKLKTFVQRRLCNDIDTSAEAYVRLVAFNNTNLDQTVYFEYEPWLIWQNWEDYSLVDDKDVEVPCQQTQSAPAAPGHTRIIIKTHLPANGYQLLRVLGPTPDLSKIGPGYTKVFTLEPKPAKKISTGKYQLTIDKKHAIRSLTNQQKKLELAKNGLFDTMVFEDKSDTFSFYETGYDKCLGGFKREKSNLIEDGPLRWSVQINSSYKKSSLRQELRLFDTSDMIEVHNWLNWNQEWHVAKFVINLPFAPARLTGGLALGQIDRPENNCEFPFHNWLLAEPLNQKSSLMGFAVLASPGLHSADFAGNAIRITVARSPIYCHEQLGGQIYTPGPRHEHMELGQHHFVIGLLPLYEKINPSELVELAGSLTDALSVVTTTAHPGTLPPSGQFIKITPSNVALSALKKSLDETGYIIRLSESAGIDTKGTIVFLGESIDFTIRAKSLLTLKLTRQKERWRIDNLNGLEMPL